MQEIGYTLDSREVAGMVKKDHKYLMRDIRNYSADMTGAQISPVDFFEESTYKDAKGEIRPCYRVTKIGCEFIAHKLTGKKGTEFTARYIKRFHEMEDILKGQQEPEPSWFIRDFKEEGQIMLFRDFKAITGVELRCKYTADQRPDRIILGRHYNAWGWKCDKKEFKEKFGFDYGDDEPCMYYLYLQGIRRAIRAVENDVEDGSKLTPEIKKMIMDGVRHVEAKNKAIISIPAVSDTIRRNPIQICITINENGMVQQV